jgi:hypothetical protein
MDPTAISNQQFDSRIWRRVNRRIESWDTRNASVQDCAPEKSRQNSDFKSILIQIQRWNALIPFEAPKTRFGECGP